MSSEAPTTQQLSEYFKHAKGQTRTAIRNGQVWEESFKRLRRDTTLTNVTGTEIPPAPQWQEGLVSLGERAEAIKTAAPIGSPFLSPSEQRGAGRTVRSVLSRQRKELGPSKVTLPTPNEATFVPFGIIPAVRPLSRGRTKVNKHGLPVSNHSVTTSACKKDI